jgi:hypothetical protein
MPGSPEPLGRYYLWVHQTWDGADARHGRIFDGRQLGRWRTALTGRPELHASGIPTSPRKARRSPAIRFRARQSEDHRRRDAARAMGNFNCWTFAAVNAIAREISTIQFRLYEFTDPDGPSDCRDSAEAHRPWRSKRRKPLIALRSQRTVSPGVAGST